MTSNNAATTGPAASPSDTAAPVQSWDFPADMPAHLQLGLLFFVGPIPPQGTNDYFVGKRSALQPQGHQGRSWEFLHADTNARVDATFYCCTKKSHASFTDNRGVIVVTGGPFGTWPVILKKIGQTKYRPWRYSGGEDFDVVKVMV